MTETIRLDGAMNTELVRRGLPIEAPWWTTATLLNGNHRAQIREVHAEYLAAGAQVITAATSHCNMRVLSTLDIDVAGPAWMVQAACGVATAARNTAAQGTNLAAVAGSIVPLGVPARPDLVPPDDELREAHGWLATELVNAFVDLVLVESMTTVREARIALAAVHKAGGPAWVSFMCGPGGTLLSGESLVEAAAAVEADGARAVLVNGTSIEDTEVCMRELAAAGIGRIGAYPSVAQPNSATAGGTAAGADPTEFAQHLHRWSQEYGAQILGGCSGTGPSHIAAMTAAIADAG